MRVLRVSFLVCSLSSAALRRRPHNQSRRSSIRRRCRRAGATARVQGHDRSSPRRPHLAGGTSPTFHPPAAGSYQIRVLAPGFAAETVDIALASRTSPSNCASPPHRKPLSSPQPELRFPAKPPAPTSTRSAERNSTTMQPVTADDAMRFLPGAVVNTAGQRGGLSSLFVRGGESTYNKVIVDGVTVNEPGGTFDFGTLSLAQGDRMEFVRGAQSTLYGSDAMTSVVQVWTRTGSTPTPELRFGADGGNFSHRQRLRLARRRARPLRLQRLRRPIQHQRLRHQRRVFRFSAKARMSAWRSAIGFSAHSLPPLQQPHRRSRRMELQRLDPWFPSTVCRPLTAAPDPTEWSQYNNLLGSVELTVAAPNRMAASLHRLRLSLSLQRTQSQRRSRPRQLLCGQFDFPSHEVDRINRAGFEYQGDYSERTWAHTTFGYRIENENGFVGDVNFGSQTHGQRLNNDVYVQQQLTLGRLSRSSPADASSTTAPSATPVFRASL